jgi:hypothetical protein
MAERNPIFNAKADNQIIGYVEDTEVFDLMGNKRCHYNPNTGNLVELDSGRIIGHVSLAGYFIGTSWIADQLFAERIERDPPTPSRTQLDAAASPVPTNSPDESTAAARTDPANEATEAPLSSDVERALEMIRITLGPSQSTLSARAATWTANAPPPTQADIKDEEATAD